MQYDTTDFVETNGEATMKLIARTRRLTREYYMTDHEDAERRRAILEELLGEIGKNVEIDTPFYCDYGKNIHIGSDVIINMNCTFVDNKPIRIGSKVLIASNVQIYTSSHPILPGVTIGKNSVVGAGSVVTRSIPANCVAVGNPCRVIRRFGEDGPDDALPSAPNAETTAAIENVQQGKNLSRTFGSVAELMEDLKR